MESKPTGGGQLRLVTFSQSACGEGQLLSPPKFPQSLAAGSGALPSISRFSKKTLPSPTKWNCITRPIAGTTSASTWPLLSTREFGQPWYVTFETETERADCAFFCEKRAGVGCARTAEASAR